MEHRRPKVSWVTQLEGALACGDGDVPEGFKTANQIATELNLTRRGAANRIQQWMGSGKVVMRLYRVTSGQVTRPVPHYCETKSLPKNFQP